jgi:hypothetical protein
MDRRQFLVRAASVLGALITPSFVREAEAFARSEHSPLLLPPSAAAKRTLIAVPSSRGYLLHIGDPDERVPEWTWRELAEEHGYYDEDALEFVADHNDGCTRRELRALLRQPADHWLVAETWEGCYASNTLAFNYLDGLDLGPEFGEAPGARGDLSFIEGYHPGNDTRAVEAADALTLSLLQARLVELGESTTLEVRD